MLFVNAWKTGVRLAVTCTIMGEANVRFVCAVCVCVCLCVWMWVCVDVGVCGCGCVWMWVCVDVGVCTVSANSGILILIKLTAREKFQQFQVCCGG